MNYYYYYYYYYERTEYVIHFKKKSSCSSSYLQWLPGNHCTGMLPLQSDGQSLVQLIDNTRFCLASATRNSVRKSGKNWSALQPPSTKCFYCHGYEQLLLLIHLLSQLETLTLNLYNFKLISISWQYYGHSRKQQRVDHLV